MAITIRMTPRDFRTGTLYHLGEDWPISYADIEPYYDKVDLYLGISGHPEGLAHLPDSKFQRATRLNTAEVMLRQQNYNFDDESRQAFIEYLKLRIGQPQFANARSVRNAIDRIRLRQASRLVHEGGRIGKEELARIAAVDVRQSRVFQGGLDGETEADTANGAPLVRGKEE